MGGRKGHSLKKIVGDLRKTRAKQKELLEGINNNNPEQVVRASAGILARSDTALESLAHSFLFAGGIEKKEQRQLSKKNEKSRRKELAKKWAVYRKEKGKKFDPTINRDVVDSANKILGGAR